jgi:hypothetical protein
MYGVNDAVAYGVHDGRIAEKLMLLRDGKSGRHQRGGPAMAVLQDHKQSQSGCSVEYLEPEVI